MTILEKISENALRDPSGIAYTCDDIRRGERVHEELSWAELEERSGRLATALDSRLTTKTPVLVYGHKAPLMLICFLACVKAGRAYVPVDSSVPMTRVLDIARAVEPELILAAEGEPDASLGRVISGAEINAWIDGAPAPLGRERRVGPEDLFYIIFTSGSTGKPKGVQITRSCLDNFIRWGITLCGDNDGAPFRFLNQAPFSFDLSVMDLYLSLYLGGTEMAVGKSLAGDMRSLCGFFRASGITTWVSTPSFADVCLAERSFREELLPELRTFLFCGETLSNRTADQLRKNFPKARVINTYGPTESTVAVTGVEITPEVSRECSPLPVGVPRPGTRIRIADAEGYALPDGEKGEIVILGDTVSPGYWRSEEKTREAFFLSPEADGSVLRAYRTGDEGYLWGGMLHYCGRIDLQIKLHGYRIELEDIENNLLRLPQVRRAAVLPVYRDNGEVRSLTAYVLPEEGLAPSFEKEQEIRAGLREFVPEYMIPKKIRFVDAIPLTTNGKIDRKALRTL